MNDECYKCNQYALAYENKKLKDIAEMASTRYECLKKFQIEERKDMETHNQWLHELSHGHFLDKLILIKYINNEHLTTEDYSRLKFLANEFKFKLKEKNNE